METVQQGLNLNDIGQIAISAGNLAEATDFYRDVLGMHFLFEAGAMTFFQCGSVRLMIGASEKGAGRDGTILYFRVPDIHRAHALLQQKSVAFVQEPHLVARMKTHDLWIAFLKDPAGNTLGLMSEVERA